MGRAGGFGHGKTACGIKNFNIRVPSKARCLTQIDEFVRGDDLTRVYVTAPNSDAPFAAVQVHLTYRPEVAGEAFSVRDFEDVLNAAQGTSRGPREAT